MDYFTKYYYRPVVDMTDSFRFLAKRSLNEEVFDLTTDRYAFAVVVWEVLTEKIACRRRSTVAEITQAVCVEDEKLEMDPIWPPSLRDCLKRAFDEDDSLTMDDFAHVLEKLVSLYS